MRIVNKAVQTTLLKRRSADAINDSDSGCRLAIGRKTTRKKKNPPIIRTTEPTCIHCTKDFKNIFLEWLSAIGNRLSVKRVLVTIHPHSEYSRRRLSVIDSREPIANSDYTTGFPPTGSKQLRDCLQASGDTN